MNQNFFEPNPCYELNSSSFDQYQPLQSFVTQQIPQRSNEDIRLEMAKLIKNNQILLNNNIFPYEEASMEVLLAKERILKLIQAWEDKQIELRSLPELLPQLLNDSRTIDEMLKQREQTANLAVQQEQEEQAAQSFTPYWNFSMIDDEILLLLMFYNSEILSDSNNDDTSSDDDAFKDIEYVDPSLLDSELVSLEEENDVYQEEKEIDLEDILQIQDVILREKLLSINRLIADIEFLNDNPTPDRVLKSSSLFPIFEKSDNPLSYSDNSLPEFETFSDHTEETRSGSTTAHANNSPPEYDSFCFEIEPDQGSVNLFLISNNSIPPGIENIDYDSEGDIHFLEELLSNDCFSLFENESSNFDHHDDPSFPRPPPEPPDVEFFFDFEPNSGELILTVVNNIDELNEDECFDPEGGTDMTKITKKRPKPDKNEHEIGLTDLCTSLQRQQSDLVSKFEAQELEINRNLDEGEAAAERVSDDIEEMATVLTPMDAASILTSGGVQVVPTAVEVATATISIPAGSDVVPTASLIFATATIVTPYTRRKGKEKMVETDTPKKKKFQEPMDIQMARQLEEEMERDAQRMNEQFARDAEVTRIHAEEELQMMINSFDGSNETVLTYLQVYEQFAEDLSIGERVELINDLINIKKIMLKFSNTRLNKESHGLRSKRGITIWRSSKEEAKRFKRKGIRFEQESVKKLKTSEEVKASEDVYEEKVKEMMHLVPIEEVYVEALQVKHPIIDWKHLDREDLNQLCTLVKESLNIRPASSDKEMKLWVELKKLYEPDVEDQLWTHTHNMMQALVEWKLYDSCGVYHVTSKDNEIFMLIEKDYPLRKGLAIGRIVGNKMHKAFLLPVIELPLPEKKVPTAEEKQCHCCEDCTATKVKKKLSVKVI
nr:hypothetical protein [Tanacetum cinerariifolium]